MRESSLVVLWIAAWIVGATSGAMANEPPATPTINEPEVDGQIVNPADVHMETMPFSDPDPGDGHLCTDFEIRVAATDEQVWTASCIGGLEKVHAHFGDGLFVGSLSGESQLLYDTQYRLRVRHRDDSGDPATEWSDWAVRTFVTGPPTQIFALEADDVLDATTPTWVDESGDPIVLPVSASPPALVLETLDGLLVELQGIAGPLNLVIHYPELPDHGDLRVRVTAGDLAGGLALPKSSLAFVDHEGLEHTLYLPAMQVSVGMDALFWVSSSGATYVAEDSDTGADFSELAQGIPVPWVVNRPGYQVEIVVSGLQLPVNIAFVPSPTGDPDDPLYYVTELYGTIRVVTGGGTVLDYATNLLDYVPTGAFPGSGEQGVTGIVVEPTTGDVFAAMLYDAGGPHYPKVVRFSSLDGGLSAASQTVILDMVGESQGQSHQISNLSIGPDGKLYVHMGDGFDATTAQDLDSYRGKILRVNLDGSAPSDNPFFDAGDGIDSRDYVYAYGLRNPFGGAWRAEDGFHYEVENGPSTDRFAKIVPGQNYQWNGSDFSMTQQAILNWTPAVGPTNIAFIEPTLFGGSLFPSSMMGHAFIADSGPTWATGPQTRGKRIREYALDATGGLVEGPIDFVDYVGTGRATVVGLAAGPDGLYFTDLYRDLDATSPIDGGAHVLRVRFVGAVEFDADVTEGLAPLTVQFTDLSDVPAPTAWEWSFGDGATSTDPSPTHTYTVDGIYTVSLAVTGSNGVATTTKTGFIRVGEFRTVGLIGGDLPALPADQAIADVIQDLGLEVTLYDDEPFNRPSATELAAVYAPAPAPPPEPAVEGRERRYVDAVAEGLAQAMAEDDRVL
ncbi:MAG: PQQ-dependent sugar dehydrogenase, partial [Planctomycetes bacterium]|nr:PQQ-dependent sugar dehydrogenase [Planctomycetota bacterium]